MTKVKSKTGHTKGTEIGKDCSHCHADGLCHLKNSELERVVLRGDAVKRILARVAAKVLNVIARPLGCAGQASDAVSVYTQVKIEDAPALLKLPSSSCPDIWTRLPRHKMARVRATLWVASKGTCADTLC